MSFIIACWKFNTKNSFGSDLATIDQSNLPIPKYYDFKFFDTGSSDEYVSSDQCLSNRFIVRGHSSFIPENCILSSQADPDQQPSCKVCPLIFHRCVDALPIIRRRENKLLDLLAGKSADQILQNCPTRMLKACLPSKQ